MRQSLYILAVMFGLSGYAATPPADTAGNAGKAHRLVVSKRDMRISVCDSQSRVVVSYPIACGKNPGNKQRRGDMRTPEGVFTVVSIHDSSLWAHDFNDGKGLIRGAYGPYFIRLHTPPHKGIGIHGTHDPESIGQHATEGCIRLKNEDIEELVGYVSPGMTVIITAPDHEVRQSDAATNSTEPQSDDQGDY